jgi:hypothetical protein
MPYLCTPSSHDAGSIVRSRDSSAPTEPMDSTTTSNMSIPVHTSSGYQSSFSQQQLSGEGIRAEVGSDATVTCHALAFQHVAVSCPLCFRERHLDGSQCSEFEFMREIGREVFGPIPIPSLLESFSFRCLPSFCRPSKEELIIFRIALRRMVVRIHLDGYASVPTSLFILPAAHLGTFPRYRSADLHVMLILVGMRPNIRSLCLGFETVYDMLESLQYKFDIVTRAGRQMAMGVVCDLFGVRMV